MLSDMDFVERIKADLDILLADPREELPEVITIYWKSYLRESEEKLRVIELED